MIRSLLWSALVLSSAIALANDSAEYPSLWHSSDPELQQQLDSILHSLGYDHAIQDKRMAVALVDITDLARPKVAAVNGNTMMYAASVPKLAILLGAFVEIREGNMALDASTRNSLTEMIRFSSNLEATRMLNRVGKQRLIEILQSNEFDLYDLEGSGGLWVGKEYGKSPAYLRDPLHNYSHGATAMQVARFYYLLETGQVVGEELSAEMKGILSEPGINHKFVKGLDHYPGVEIFRKSGTWQRWHGDSALIEANNRRYIVVGLVEDARGGEWLSRLIQPIHELMVSMK
ncbi:MAG: serine hydrolase [Halioglobus sp.]|nr:serine hydrolase [Halioglobus sp.]